MRLILVLLAIAGLITVLPVVLSILGVFLPFILVGAFCYCIGRKMGIRGL